MIFLTKLTVILLSITVWQEAKAEIVFSNGWDQSLSVKEVKVLGGASRFSLTLCDHKTADVPSLFHAPSHLKLEEVQVILSLKKDTFGKVEPADAQLIVKEGTDISALDKKAGTSGYVSSSIRSCMRSVKKVFGPNSCDESAETSLVNVLKRGGLVSVFGEAYRQQAEADGAATVQVGYALFGRFISNLESHLSVTIDY